MYKYVFMFSHTCSLCICIMFIWRSMIIIKCVLHVPMYVWMNVFMLRKNKEKEISILYRKNKHPKYIAADQFHTSSFHISNPYFRGVLLHCYHMKFLLLFFRFSSISVVMCRKCLSWFVPKDFGKIFFWFYVHFSVM